MKREVLSEKLDFSELKWKRGKIMKPGGGFLRLAKS